MARPNARKRNTRLLCLAILVFVGGLLLASAWTMPVFAQQADAEVLLAQGTLFYEEQKYDKALNRLKMARKLDPKNARVHYFIGLVYLAQNKPDLAVESLKNGWNLRPNDIFIRYQLGVAYFAQDKYEQANRHLQGVFKEQPELDSLGFYVGFLRYREKNYQGALQAFKVGKTTDPNIRQLTVFYRGLSLGVLGLSEQAIAELDEAQFTGAVSPFTQSAVRLREALASGRQPSEQKRLRLQVSLGGYYDDNVAVNPNPVGPIPVRPGVPADNNQIIAGLRARPTTSPGLLASVLGDYSFFRQGPWEATVTGSFFQTVNTHANLNIFNITDVLGGISGFYRGDLGKLPYQLSAQFTYDYLLLDYDGFLQRITPTLNATLVGPILTLPLVGNMGNLTTALYRWQDKTFFREPGDNDIRFGGEVRDGFNNMLGFVHTFRFVQDQLLLRLGYQYDNESTKGQSFSYSGNRIITGGQATFPWGEVTLRYNYDVHWRAYKNSQNLFTDRQGFLVQRYDTQQTHLVQIIKPLPWSLTFTAQYQGIRNGSKIPVYDYDKNVFTGIVTWTY